MIHPIAHYLEKLISNQYLRIMNLEGLLQMNNSFIKDDAETPPFSRRDLSIIFAVGIVSASLGLFLANPVSSSFELAPLLNSVDIVGRTFATGLFSFLTAGLLFSSQASRSYLLGRINEVGAKRAYLIRTLHTFLVTSVFTFIITIIAFLQPIIPGTLIYYPAGIDYFAFLPSVLGASLVVSLCLASIATALASIVDDSRICIVLGCVSTIVIAIIADVSPDPRIWHYSVTRILAVLSPHNIARAFAVQMSGYQFESARDMVSYVGFEVSVEGLIVTLLILSSISILLLLVGQRVLARNSNRWPILKGMIPRQELWDSSVSTKEIQKMTRIRRGLRVQRGLTTMIVSVLLISMFVGGSMYVSNVVNSTTVIHYATPGFKENIPVGTWIIFDVDVPPPYPGLFNFLHFGVTVETWGNASDSLSFFFGVLDMNSTEFDLLEESTRFELLFSRLNNTFVGFGEFGFGAGDFMEEDYGSYVCVLKIISDSNPLENSYVEGSLRITQEAW